MQVSLAALVAILVCAAAFAALDALRKGLTTHLRPLPLLVWLSAGQAPLFLTWWLLADRVRPADGYWLPALASIALNVGANLAYLEAVRRAPLSLTIPLLALSPVFASLLSWLMLGEVLSVRQWLGVGLVVIGAFWLSARPDAGSASRLMKGRRQLVGPGLMIVTAFLWAAALPFDKLALNASGPPWHGLVVNGGVGITTAALLLASTRGRELRPGRAALRLLIVAVVVSGVALGAQLVAMALTWVSLVETLKRAFGTMAAVGVGWWIFGERLTLGKLGAALLLAGGVALVLL